MSSSITLRIKTSSGNHVIRDLTVNSSLGDLYSKVSELTGIVSPALLVGYPPKPITSTNMQELLSDVGVKSGEMLTVKESAGGATSAAAKPVGGASSNSGGHMSSAKQADTSSTSNTDSIQRIVVPADNSCLFTSVNYIMTGNLDTKCATEMRGLVAAIVSSDPDTYTEAMLGKSNADYCEWIQNASSWGGAIEVSILAHVYSIELAVVDINTVRVDRFTEDKGYDKRGYLLYDGIHYDPLAKKEQRIFSPTDDAVLAQAQSLASDAKAKRQYTDVQNFDLRCMVCQQGLKGQAEAMQHAKATGHTNFGEF